ncbi:hypothetical protein PENTCL1PPCAC_19288, partial [Pristionchus entomophagus]
YLLDLFEFISLRRRVLAHLARLTDRAMATNAPNNVGASEDGVIQWEVDKNALLRQCPLYSPSIEVRGMQWRILLLLDPDLSFYLVLMDGDYSLQSFDWTIKYALLNHDNNEKSIVVQTKTFHRKKGAFSSGYVNFADMDKINEKGFIKDNKLTVEADFSVSNIKGFRKLRRIDFTDPNEPSHDLALVIGGEKMFASKQHLAIYSPVFHAMFYGEFAEKNQKEIKLKDIDHQEFVEMLNVIYPPHQTISGVNFEYLLKLGDRFQIKMIVDQCEKYLLKDSPWQRFGSISFKLTLAARYHLVDLQEQCLDRLNTIKEVTDLRNSVDFKNFSDAIKIALFDKIIQLCG